MSADRSRWIENVLAIVGIAQAALYGTMEALARGGFLTHSEHAGFPWVTIIIFAGCVLPKTLGRATAGRVWDALASKVGSSKP